MFNILLVQIAELRLFKYKNTTNKETSKQTKTPSKQKTTLPKPKMRNFLLKSATFKKHWVMNYKQEVKMETLLHLNLQCLLPSA